MNIVLKYFYIHILKVIYMVIDRTLNELRKKAHELNCNLAEEDFDPREIEIIGYYLTRIAASYLSYFTHKELGESEETGKITKNY